MRHSSIPSAQSIVQHCKVKGIKNIIISPGSRNAPLTLSFTEDPFFTCYSIVDERCAGFFALGIAQQTRQPTVLSCTSGSALLNYYPAIAEAFYSDIPLIVVSADRPLYKIDVGDGQTIRQDKVFEKHIGYSANLKQDVAHATEKVKKYVPHWLIKDSLKAIQDKVQAFNDQELNTAINIALEQVTPVHINVPFEEPLYNLSYQDSISSLITFDNTVEKTTIYNIEKFQNIWNASHRKMVLVGVSRPSSVEQEILNKLADDPSVVLLTETTSNLNHTDFFPSIDSLLAPIEKSKFRDLIFEKLRPEIILTFGGLLVSKKIKAFLRNYQPKHHWHVDSKRAFDTFFILSEHIKMDVGIFLKEFLLGTKPVKSDYFTRWSYFKRLYVGKRKTYLSKIPFSDMKVFEHVLGKIPRNHNLQLANSSAVRYAQLFDMEKSVQVFCNRGTSGIDGSTSTAIGASLYSSAPTVLITGDLSFLYDSNGLWNNYIRADFRIIVINNSGGGIFRILPGKEDTSNFETYFETSHGLNAQSLCEMFGIGYRVANDQESLERASSDFYKISKKPQLLEIFTPRLLNDKILIGYFDFISSGIINH